MPGRVMAYIGLGSNLENPVGQVKVALGELNNLPQTRLRLQSSLYQSAPMPMSPANQPDYINAVAALETSLAADDLLSALQGLELLHHRVRKERWGPRSLDLDLLLYGDECIVSEHLTVPHPGLTERVFVLLPLFEIAPALRLPDNRSLADLVEQCGSDGLTRI